MTSIKDDIKKYIETIGDIKINAVTGVTLTYPTINEICTVFRVDPIFVVELLNELNINTGIYYAEERTIKKTIS